jgi:hypothetical protein
MISAVAGPTQGRAAGRSKATAGAARLSPLISRAKSSSRVRPGSRRQVCSSLATTAPVGPAGTSRGQTPGRGPVVALPSSPAARPLRAVLGARPAGRRMTAGSSLAQAAGSSPHSAASPPSAAATRGQSERSAAATATGAQPEGSIRKAVASAEDGPVASCWPSTAASDQPPEASAMVTAMSSPPSSWPRRELKVAARAVTTTRELPTTSPSCGNVAGTATRTGTTPSRVAATTRAAKATRVTAGANPTSEAPSSPAARRRGGSGDNANHSGRRPTPAPRTTIGPMTQPTSQARPRAASRSTMRLGCSKRTRPSSSVPTPTPARWPGGRPPCPTRRASCGPGPGAGRPASRPPPGPVRRPEPGTLGGQPRQALGGDAGADQPHEGVIQRAWPRTCSRVPEATRRPPAITPTWSQTCSTRAITWRDSTTDPPASTKRCRITRMVAADTGSIASNGSSRTSSRGVCSRAVARVIFLRIPAE